MRVRLISYTPNPESVVLMAIKTSYSNEPLELYHYIYPSIEDKKLIKQVIKRGHHSVLEHISFTFLIEEVSRVLTHQLVRHRTFKFTQQSQRYAKVEQFNYDVIPDTIKENEEAKKEFYSAINKARRTYYNLINDYGIHKEDARYVLPSSTMTRILMTTDARNLIHFLELRCCLRAQKEIRELAEKILELVKPLAPTIFGEAGRTCINKGYCIEGFDKCPVNGNKIKGKE